MAGSADATTRRAATVQRSLCSLCWATPGSRPGGAERARHGPGIIGGYTNARPGQEWSRWWRRYCAGADAGPSGGWRPPPPSTPPWAGRCAWAPTRLAARSATGRCCGPAPATGSAARRPARIRYPRPGRSRRPRIPAWWRSWWMAQPEANVILVTGRVFDVLDVPGHGRSRGAGPDGAVSGPARSRRDQRGEPGPVLCGDPRHAGRRGRMVVLPPGLRARDEPRGGRAALALPEQLRARPAVPGRQRGQGALAAPAGRTAAAGRARLLGFLADACEGTA